MFVFYKNLSFVLLVSALFMLPAGSPAAAQQVKLPKAAAFSPRNEVPVQVESVARRLMYEFDRRGYEVLRGYFKLYSGKDCDLSWEVLHTCLGNNPAAPYVFPVVPPWPDKPGPGEWVDAATVGAFGETAPGYNVSYRLDPREALVILAQMPPPADYFGFQTYLFTREGVPCTDSDQYDLIEENIDYLLPILFSPVPKEPHETPRAEIMADLTNSLNDVVIKRQSVNVWNQLRYFIVTPNPAMNDAIRAAFKNIGIAGHDIFTEQIPGNVQVGMPAPACPPADAIRFGLDRDADDFVTAIRYAMPMSDVAGDRWRTQLPLVVLRVKNRTADVHTYPWTPFEQRTPSVPPETWYNASPQNYLNTLTDAVCDSWKKPGTPQDCSQEKWAKLLNMQLDLHLTGPDCVPAWMNCLAPGEDATYFMGRRLQFDSNQFLAVVGALGTGTENATYVGLGLNSSDRQFAFHNISDDELRHSAKGYSDVVPEDKFFVQYIARDCAALAGQLPPDKSFACYSLGDTLPYCTDAVPGCDKLVLSLRGYIRPGTERGSDKESVLRARYILLNTPKP